MNIPPEPPQDRPTQTASTRNSIVHYREAPSAKDSFLQSGPAKRSKSNPERPVGYATLKFDDLRPRAIETAVTPIEQSVYEMLHKRNIHHGWGVDQLHENENPRFFRWLKARHAEGIEIWHHGNHHDRTPEHSAGPAESCEFKNRSEASQLENLLVTQETIFEKTGIIMRTFGAPYNQTDEATGRALNQVRNLEIMFFGQCSPNFEGLMLNDQADLEVSTGVIATLDAFKDSYARQQDAEIIVLQGHPAYWDAERDLPKLTAILDFVEAEGRVFITPSDYLDHIRRQQPKNGDLGNL